MAGLATQRVVILALTYAPEQKSCTDLSRSLSTGRSDSRERRCMVARIGLFDRRYAAIVRPELDGTKCQKRARQRIAEFIRSWSPCARQMHSESFAAWFVLGQTSRKLVSSTYVAKSALFALGIDTELVLTAAKFKSAFEELFLPRLQRSAATCENHATHSSKVAWV